VAMRSSMARARSGGLLLVVALLLLLGCCWHSSHREEAFLGTSKQLMSNDLRRTSSQGGTILRRAVSPEKVARRLIDEWPDNPDNDDIMELTQALKKLPDVASTDAFAQLPGNWKVEWSSRGGSASKRSGPAQLKFMSFGALPGDPAVIFTGSYNRVLQDGRYELLQVFTLPDAADDAEAAMVLSGPWTSGTSEGEWGQGAQRNRCGVQFETVRLALSATNPEASKAMLSEAGLLEYMEPQNVKARATYIDVNFINQEWRWHKGESGDDYVLERMEGDVPFALD